MHDRNSNWKNSKSAKTLTPYQSKLQFIENWFKFEGDMGFFDGKTLNIKKYLFELSGTGIESVALKEIENTFRNFRNTDGSDMGIRLITSRSKITYNFKYESYDFDLTITIDGTETKFERRMDL